MSRFVRGRVYLVDSPSAPDAKFYVIVSNNTRNRNLVSALGVRLTTSSVPALPTVVPLSSADPLVGFVLCDAITELFDDEIKKESGALSPKTMRLINEGLMNALALA